ncbi:uncharacterized protein LOC129726105 isoform X2 [Wyeomyia smithii]|uniref:uncharacterized protein LOC129726105 isoform X2 n=1 Tax=Wyeomyia smithii TaxID=174621 RepID=UPI0024681F6E|nr:uncharacterized protein LOC129726105 isoform X2 [Wyeomyia smithii]XP_055539136.1 uncharacterized protein LOC129726105 isoform X2 [Wyeomyia smithii]XP_055539222.1 uncharacterized protein LOC129726105 isoform X2 [Wyeomyia smithii]XP_055539311.1 uncharacterized protein LOC129726105 isoform X2 [Wyeomyia smithii]
MLKKSRNPRMSYIFNGISSSVKFRKQQSKRVDKRTGSCSNRDKVQTEISAVRDSEPQEIECQQSDEQIRGTSFVPDIFDRMDTSESLRSSDDDDFSSNDQQDFLSQTLNATGKENEPTNDSTHSELLHPMLTITKNEVMFLLLNIFIRHKLTNVALVDSLQMLNIFVGVDALPDNFRQFNNFFSRRCYRRQFMRVDCGLFLGEQKEKCENCDSVPVTFFIEFDFVSELRRILLQNWQQIRNYVIDSIKNSYVADIMNSAVYKERNLKNGITLSMNTDGVKIFNSAKSSLWPIMFQINELPPCLRFLRKNMVIAGLWLANKDPNLNVFFETLYANFPKTLQ